MPSTSCLVEQRAAVQLTYWLGLSCEETVR